MQFGMISINGHYESYKVQKGELQYNVKQKINKIPPVASIQP